MDDAKWGQTLEGDKADETPVFEGKKITFISSNVNVATKIDFAILEAAWQKGPKGLL